MKRRNIATINTGSMADIAFLLLIFFLVSTTIEADEGIQQNLPEWSEEPASPFPKQNMLKIMINDQGEMLINGVPGSLADVYRVTREFYTNDGVFQEESFIDEMPVRKWVNNEKCKSKLIQLNQENSVNQSELDQWQKLEKATSVLGPFKKMPETFSVSIFFTEKSDYQSFIDITNEIESALNDMRNELALEITGNSFDKLKKGTGKERQIYNAIQVVYPKSVSDHLVEQ